MLLISLSIISISCTPVLTTQVSDYLDSIDNHIVSIPISIKMGNINKLKYSLNKKITKFSSLSTFKEGRQIDLKEEEIIHAKNNSIILFDNNIFKKKYMMLLKKNSSFEITKKNKNRITIKILYGNNIVTFT